MSRVSITQVRGGRTLEERMTALKNVLITLTQPLEVPTQVNELVYNGNPQTPVWTDVEDTSANEDALLQVEYEPQTEPGEYTATFTPAYGYAWTDGTDEPKTVTWKIKPVVCELPKQLNRLVYNGSPQAPAWSAPDMALIQVECEPQTEPGEYTATFTLTHGCAWTDGTNEPKFVKWEINQRHVMGMVLVEEGNKSGTWVRVDKDFNTVEFNPEHGTWAGIKQVTNATYGEFTEIPVTYVKTETLQSGPYAGKNCWWIADGPESGFHVHPAFIGADGQPHNLQIASWVASNKNSVPFSEDKGNSKDGYWNNISYNTVHAKGWMTGGARPYNIYDYHFLARMMLTEFGTPDVQSQTVDGVAWTGANRISYHGIHDPFGLPNYDEYYWLDGLTTLNGTYQVLAADGSGNMVETGISCPDDRAWPINCRVDQVNGINFGDLFIANMANSTENSGSFADAQNLNSGYAFNVRWNTDSRQGAFYLNNLNPVGGSNTLGWRVALCS